MTNDDNYDGVDYAHERLAELWRDEEWDWKEATGVWRTRWRTELERAFQAGVQSYLRGRSQPQNPMWSIPDRYVRCPGCGDNGDAAHVAACMTERIGVVAEKVANGWERGAMFMLHIAMVQLRRRGTVNVSRLKAAMADAVRRLRT